MQSREVRAFTDAARATRLRYKASGKFAFHYVGSKLRRDPVARELFELGSRSPFGTVVDLGCGRGQFSACLLHAGIAKTALGIDFSTLHLAQASAAMHDLDFRALHQDFAVDQHVPLADTILLIDVLYQLPAAAQSELIVRAAHAARHRLIVRTASPALGLRSIITRAAEIVFRPVWPHSGREVNAQPIADLAAVMTACGLQTTIAPCWKGTPFSNVLLVGERAATQDASDAAGA